MGPCEYFKQVGLIVHFCTGIFSIFIKNVLILKQLEKFKYSLCEFYLIPEHIVLIIICQGLFSRNILCQ